MGTLALVAALSLGSPALASAATVTGTVSWATVPARRVVPISRDRHVCLRGSPIVEPFVDVDSRGRVTGALVWFDDLPPEPALAEASVAIDQVGCMFVPVVAAARVGSSLKVSTSDPVLHNVHVVDGAGRTVANWAMPVRGQEVSLRLDRPGELRLRCQAGHDWMRASVRVFDHHAYALTGAGGRFEIRDVPPGVHLLIAWHPEIGRVERRVVVGDGQAQVDVLFPGLPNGGLAPGGVVPPRPGPRDRPPSHPDGGRSIE